MVLSKSYWVDMLSIEILSLMGGHLINDIIAFKPTVFTLSANKVFAGLLR